MPGGSDLLLPKPCSTHRRDLHTAACLSLGSRVQDQALQMRATKPQSKLQGAGSFTRSLQAELALPIE